MHAEIKKEYDDCLWLHIHRGNGEGSSHPLLGDEIEAIRDACNEYLLESEEKDDNKNT